MKKLALFAGVLITLSVLTQSCSNSHKIARPQRHPRPPRNLAYVQPQAVVAEHAIVIG